MEKEKISGWRVYQHALIPDCEPHEQPAAIPSFRKLPLSILFERWTTDFDCKQEMPFWYEILDSPFDASTLNAKRRSEITKGKKHFLVVKIDPRDYKNEITDIYQDAIKTYPSRNQTIVTTEMMEKKFISDTIGGGCQYYGAFVKDADGFNSISPKLCGVAIIKYSIYKNTMNKCISLSELKVIPEFEHLGVNAALVNGVVESYKELLIQGYYICDGARSTRHKTNFQDYLEKYFCFRKAYCVLRIKMRWYVSFLVHILYPFRNKLKRSSIKLFFDFGCLCEYASISSECQKRIKCNV
jgi:hypothetical protein